MTIYDKVKALAEKKGYNISLLEREAGIANGTISKWSECNPRVENLKKVADILKVKIEELI